MLRTTDKKFLTHLALSAARMQYITTRLSDIKGDTDRDTLQTLALGYADDFDHIIGDEERMRMAELNMQEAASIITERTEEGGTV